MLGCEKNVCVHVTFLYVWVGKNLCSGAKQTCMYERYFVHQSGTDGSIKKVKTYVECASLIYRMVHVMFAFTHVYSCHDCVIVWCTIIWYAVHDYMVT